MFFIFIDFNRFSFFRHILCIYKIHGVYNPLKTESTAEIVSSSKSNADKSESSSEAFFRDNRESFFKK
jgi:hypothetical protein